MATFGSLFSGIGGIDLGLEWAGWTCRWQCEQDPFRSAILARHWPGVTRYSDARTVDWGAVEPVDLIAGGFPCQPTSNAGRRGGPGDPRWLWPVMADAVRVLGPRFVVVENVPGLLAGHGGMGDVLADLAALGMDARWDSVPAAAIGAPHLRYRVWIIAQRAEFDWPVADSDHLGRSHPDGPLAPGRNAPGPGGRPVADTGWPDYRPRPWPPEPHLGRVAHGIPAGVDRIKALGDAAVPQAVEVIGRFLRPELRP